MYRTWTARTSAASSPNAGEMAGETPALDSIRSIPLAGAVVGDGWRDDGDPAEEDGQERDPRLIVSSRR
jgi:hypothetical protein